jgi:hypothetical protein
VGGTRKKNSTRKVRTPARGKKKKTARVAAKSKQKPSLAAPRFDVRALDPKERCGARTSVEQLYRVDESASDGTTGAHLVFFDRHGWYCIHGASCPAIPHARKFGDRIPAMKSRGSTHNGRMRA